MSIANLVAHENEKLNKSEVRKKRTKVEEESSELVKDSNLKGSSGFIK